MAITGLGGIGKTQLAIEYAYRHRTNYQAVLWAHAYSYEALISSYVTIAFLLHLPEQKAQEQEVVVQAIKTWLQTHSGWLLILDNADDLAVLHAFLPPDYSGHILLTTRAQAMGRLARRLNMDTLSSDLGTLFLLHRTGLLATEATLEQASPTDRQAAESLTFDLGGLPLALDQAGAYIEETGSSLAAYQQLYRHHRAALLRDRRGQVFDHPDPVATTWALDFQRIEQAQPAAIDLLRLCAFLASDSVPEELLTAGAPYLGPILGPVVADTFLLNQAIEALRTRSLIQWDPTRKTLSIHCLVQAVLQDSIGQEERQQWIERTVQAVWAAFPRAEFIHWPACERCLPHAQACLSLIEQESITSAEAAQLLTRMGWYFMECGRYQEARVSVQQTLQLQERDLEPVHLGTAQSLNLLARLHEKQGEYALAEPLYQRALAIYEKQLGSEHPHVATSLNNLAVLYMSQGKYEQAEPLYVRSLAIYEKHMGPGHPNTATSLNNLASLFRKQGKYEQAEPLYQKTLAIYEQHMGPEHPSIATSLNNLALLYKIQGKYEQAEPLYQHALAIYEKHLGPRHPDTATSFNNLAGLYEQQGMYAEAEPLYQQAFSIREEHLEPGHPDIATSLNNLARLYERQSKYEQAEPLYQHALAIFEQKLGPRHPDTLVVRENYAWLLRAIGHSTVET